MTDPNAQLEQLREENQHYRCVIAMLLRDRAEHRLDTKPKFSVAYKDLDRLHGRAVLARSHSRENEIVEYALLDGLEVLPL